MTEKPIGTKKRSSSARSGLLFEIEQGRFATNHRLPGERDLALMLSVSRTTLRKALAELIASGRIEQRQGFGTFVVRQPSSAAANAAPGLDDGGWRDSPGEVLLEQGTAVAFKDLTKGIFRPRAEEMMMLDLASDPWVGRSSRLWFDQNDCPLAHEVTVIPSDRPEAKPPQPALGGSRLPSIVRTIRRIRTAALEDSVAVLLRLSEKTIGIITEERRLAADRRCVAFTRLSRPLLGFDIAYEQPVAEHDDRPPA